LSISFRRTNGAVAGIVLHALWFIATTASLLSSGTLYAQEPAASCSLRSVARLSLNESAGRFTTTVNINDHPVVMLIDTGAAYSAISPESAAQLGLPQNMHKKIVVHGIGRELRIDHPVVAHSFNLGDGDLLDYELTVANIAGPGEKGPNAPSGLLGIDLLSDYELEFDFPNHTLTLYSANNCSGTFVPWSGQFDTMPGQRLQGGQLTIPISLNGHSISAVVDTGSNRSSIGIDTAHNIGVSDEDLQTDHPASFMGASGVPVGAYKHYFSSFTIGHSTFRQAPLFVQTASFGTAQMLLGLDVLRWRKLWVSYGTGQTFLQYTPAHQQPPSP
jgi:predicted aspartyl protease